jgi:hypothetical protein
MASALEQKRNNQLKERAVELEFQINRLGNLSSLPPPPKNSGHGERPLREFIHQLKKMMKHVEPPFLLI